MDVAFISEFRDGQRVFRFVDTEDRSCPVQVNGSDPLEASYCQRVIDGRLPELIRDASRHAAARELPATAALPVGAHLSVPIRFSDGRIFGTLCCFSYTPDETLHDGSVDLLRALATFVAIVLEHDEAERGEAASASERINAVLDAGGPTIVYQPIVDMVSSRAVGVEALARFPDGRPPDVWFQEAWRTGCGVELELGAVRAALTGYRALPEELYLSVNLSPATLWGDNAVDLLLDGPVDRLVVELTEHAAIEDPAALTARLDKFTARGGRIAIDDVGMGFSGLHQLVELAPDVIKLDRSLIAGIDRDFARQAIVPALLTYADKVGADVVAEGVETPDEAAMLLRLGVRTAQGYHFARPGPPHQLDLAPPPTMGPTAGSAATSPPAGSQPSPEDLRS